MRVSWCNTPWDTLKGSGILHIPSTASEYPPFASPLCNMHVHNRNSFLHTCCISVGLQVHAINGFVCTHGLYNIKAYSNNYYIRLINLWMNYLLPLYSNGNEYALLYKCIDVNQCNTSMFGSTIVSIWSVQIVILLFQLIPLYWII